MATYAELMDAARRAHAAGETDHARRLVHMAQKLQKEQPETEDKSWGKTIWENIAGDDDPTTQNFGEKLGTALNMAGESLTLGLAGDETSARVESLFGADYEKRRNHYRGQEALFEKTNPKTAIAAELAPILIPGVGAAGVAAKGASLGTKMKRAAAYGAGAGGTYGFMEGEEGVGPRLENAAWTGIPSAFLSAGAPAVGAGIRNILKDRRETKAMKGMIKTAPTIDALKREASELYDAGVARGEIATAEDVGDLTRKVHQRLVKDGIVRENGQIITRDADVRNILGELQDMGETGLRGVEVKPIRELFTAATKSTNPAHARIGKILQKEYDAFVQERAPEFRQGDELYSRAKKAEMVDRLIEEAEAKASGYSQSGLENSLRAKFRQADLAGIRKSYPGMTDDEIAALRRVARGAPIENRARGIGKAAPSGIVSASMGGGIPFLVGDALGVPGMGTALGVGTMATGFGAKKLAEKLQMKNAKFAKALSASGGKMPGVKPASDAEAMRILLMERLLTAASPRLVE